MFEKVNPSHPDKVADRIAGAIVCICYDKLENPKVAVEVLIGHGKCNVIVETDAPLQEVDVVHVIEEIAPEIWRKHVLIVPQDKHLADNQSGAVRCGDNGIFVGMPVTDEQKKLTEIAERLYDKFPTDGKYIIDGENLVICQSWAKERAIRHYIPADYCAQINPLGEWEGGTDVDTGATNRKLGSDMGDAVTGGGLHGKDLSKADVSVNIACHIRAQEKQQPVKARCAIGDEYITFRYADGTIEQKPYAEVVAEAAEYINSIGGFYAFAEWGLIR